jgi:hypothetical protein
MPSTRFQHPIPHSPDHPLPYPLHHSTLGSRFEGSGRVSECPGGQGDHPDPEIVQHRPQLLSGDPSLLLRVQTHQREAHVTPKPLKLEHSARDSRFDAPGESSPFPTSTGH